jgi:hypothetical protein
MIGWWPGNGNGLDRAGTVNGQLINGVSFAPGKVDQAFSLNAPAQQFVSVDGTSYLINNAQGSIMAWVNPTSTSAFRMIAAFGSGNPGEAVGFGINEGNVRVYHHTEAFDWLTSVSVGTNVWTFLAYTWDGTTERLYKNGELVDSRSRNFNYAPTYGRVGFGFINDPSVFFPGLIDEVAVFNRTLTAGEISAVYSSGTAGICLPCAVKPSNLVSKWRAEGNALDSAGSNHGAAEGNLAYAQGMVGQAFELNGTTANVRVPASASLDVGSRGGMTVEMWIRPVSVSPAPLAEWSTNLTGAHFWIGGFDIPGNLFINLIDTSGAYHTLMTGGGVVNVNEWQHVAFTYDKSTGVANIYRNGNQVASTSMGSFTPRTTADLYLGVRTFTGHRFNGRMDEVGLYDRALSQSELAAIYDARSAGICGSCTAPPANMDAWWTGDGNSFDMQGPTFEHGTLMGNAGYTVGRVGQAFNFSGAQGDYVEIANAAMFNPTGGFTVDGWYYIDPAAPGNANEIATLIGKSEGSTGNGWTLYFDDRSSVGASRSLKWAVGGIVEAVNAIPSAGWYHIAGTWDPTAIPRSKLYVNGNLIADSGSAAWNISHNSLNVRIGAMHWTDVHGLGNDRMNGKADEVEFISRALAPSELQAVFNAGSAGKCRPQCYQLPQSVVGWWKGNGDATDAIFGNNGTLMNGAGYGTGMVDQAFSLDQSAHQYVDLPAAPSYLLNNSAGSITSWVNPSSVGDNDMIAVFGSGGNGEGVGLGIWGNIRIYHHTAWYDWQTNTPVAANTWTHIAYTWDETTERIYKNGVFAESRPRNFNYVPGNARIGYGWWYDTANFFPGKIDEVLIFNNTLSQTQIAGMFAAGAAGTCAPQAADVTITGRVMTPEGASLRNATVTLTDGSGTTRSVTTSSFGYYTFEGVAPGQSYTVGVRSRRYRFTSRQVNVTGNVTDFDFVGQE